MSRIRSIFQSFGFAILTALLATNAHAHDPNYTGAQIEAAAEIERLRADWVEAYRSQNVEAISAFYHPDATFAGTLQPFWLEGADEIQDLWARYFAAWETVNIIFRQPQVRFYGDDTVSVDTGYLEMYMIRGNQTVITNIRYSITRVRDEKMGWAIANMNVARLPGTQ